MIHGIDVSKWQGKMDWGKALAAGAHYAYLRAGSIDAISGKCYVDEQFEANYAGAAGRLPIGCYWYLRLDKDPVLQAKFFLGLMEHKVFQLPPVIDVEMAGSAVAVSKFAEVLVSALGGLPMIYTRANVWDNLLGDKSFAKGFFLWIAHYDVAVPNLPKTWPAWDVWQYRSGDDGSV